MRGIHVEFRTAAEVDAFLEIVESLATKHGIAKSGLRAIRNKPSPHFKLGSIYQSDKVILSSLAVIATEALDDQSKMSGLRRDYPFSEFKALAESLDDSFRQKFREPCTRNNRRGHKVASLHFTSIASRFGNAGNFPCGSV